MLYIIIFLILAVLTLLDLVEDKGILKAVSFWSIIASLIFLSSIRWETGPDWESYLYFFRDINLYTSTPGLNLIEPGYTLLNLWVASISNNYTVLLTLLAILTIGIKANVFFKHREIMMISLFLYYCYYLADIASVRQFLAISITLFSTRFILNKKVLPFILLVLAAVSIHISAVVFFFAYPLYHIRYSRYFLIGCIGFSFVLGMINISEIIVERMVALFGLNSGTAEKLLRYGDQGIESTNSPYMSFLLGFAKRVIVLPLFIFSVHTIRSEFQSKYKGYLNLLIFGNVIYFLFALSIPVITRLSVYFLIYELFLWAYLLISIKDLRLKFLMLALVILFGAFRLYSFIAPYKDLYVPFQTIFDSHYIDRY